MKKIFAMFFCILLSFVLSSCSNPSTNHSLEIKGEKSGNLIGLDLTSVNDLAKKVDDPNFYSLSMSAMTVQGDKINLNYTYRNKNGESVCFLAYSFSPGDNFSHLSISHAEEGCLDQAAKISGNDQIMGKIAQELFKNLNKKHYDDYTITFMGKDKNNRKSYSIRKNK